MASRGCWQTSRRPYIANVGQQLLMNAVKPVALSGVPAFVVDVRDHFVDDRERRLERLVVWVLWVP